MQKKKTSYFKDREVIDLLKTFSRQELKDFASFLKYKGSINVWKLHEILRKKHPSYSIKDESLYKSIRPEKTFNPNVFNGWVAELYRLAKEYVTINELLQDQYLSANIQALALLKRRAEGTYRKTHADAVKALAKLQLKTVDYYDYLHGLEDIHYQFVTVFNHLRVTESLQQAADYHDHRYLVLKLKYLVTMKNRHRIVKGNYNYNMEKEILDYLERNPQEGIPLIKLYQQLVQLYQDISNHGLFSKFKTDFIACRHQIGSEEIRQLLTFSTNICYWNICNGQLAFLKERFELTKILVEEGHALVEGFIPSYHFRSIMRNALEAKQLDWAEWFLSENLPFTCKGDYEDMKALCGACLYFAKGDTQKQQECMEYLNQRSSFSSINTEIVFRVLRLKTNYIGLPKKPKQKEKDAFVSQLDSFNLFLKRQNKIPEYHKESCQNFKRGLSLIYHRHHGKKAINFDIKEKIYEMGNVLELVWLLDNVG